MNATTTATVPLASRRRFLRQLTGGLFTLGTGTAAYSTAWERRNPVLVQSSLPCPRLRESQHGIKVLHLSDLHADDWTPAVVIERAVELAHQAAPDLIVFTGDFITANPDRLVSLAKDLRGLRAPLGIYACLGNHDVWHGRARVSSALTQLGIRPLINESLRLQAPGGPLWITGLDSAWAGQVDLQSALRHWNPTEPNLILLHEPDAADMLDGHHIAAVQLSGHTHGGQVRAPWFGAIQTPHMGDKYILGHYRVGDMHLHVNPGLGTMGVPFRFLCRPEVSLHTLVPA